MTRAFGYLRLSRDRESSTSIDKQRASVEVFCIARGWEVVDWFKDLDVSGARESRPGLDAMLARLNEVDAIVVHRLDRIMRSGRQFSRLLDRLAQHNVIFTSATEPLDTSGTVGEMFQMNLAYIGQIEREIVGERIRATKAHIARQGRFGGGPRAFGWTYDPETKQLEHVPHEADALRAAARALVAGQGLNAIARALENGDLIGAPTPRPGGGSTPWTATTVRRVLTSYRLVGFVTYHGKPASEAPTLEPILDPDTFEAVQRELRRRRRAQVRLHGNYELTGLLVCGVAADDGICGAKMYASPGRGGRLAYRCNARVVGHGNSINKDFVESEVTRRFLNKVDHERHAKALKDLEIGDHQDHELNATLARLEWGLEELHRDYYQERRLERDSFELQEQEISERIALLRAKMQARPEPASRKWLEAFRELRDVWRHYEPQEKRAALTLFIERILVLPTSSGRRPTRKRVTIDWR